ncbi:MAG: hypothetical protein GXP55_06395 [Deltaproteobacteria bacterium]|nr:hypothetical protein [Deltaproteobacteria bacterium]
MENGQIVKVGEVPPRLRSRAVVALAGLLAWLLLGPLPLALSSTPMNRPWLAWPAPLACLALGVSQMGRRPRVSRALLLGVFPPLAILGAFLLQPAAGVGLGALATGVAALGMLLYVAGSVRILGGAMELAPSVSARSKDEGHVPGERRRRLASSLWVVLTTAGAFSVLAIAPYVEDDTLLTARFGSSAMEARLLMASVGASLGLGALAFVVAPSLRTRRPSAHERRRRWLRFGLYLLALTTGALLVWRL